MLQWIVQQLRSTRMKKKENNLNPEPLGSHSALQASYLLLLCFHRGLAVHSSSSRRINQRRAYNHTCTTLFITQCPSPPQPSTVYEHLITWVGWDGRVFFHAILTSECPWIWPLHVQKLSALVPWLWPCPAKQILDVLSSSFHCSWLRPNRLDPWDLYVWS